MPSNNKPHPLHVAMISLFFTGIWTNLGFNPVIKISELTIRGAAEATSYNQDTAFAREFIGFGELLGIIHVAALMVTLGAVLACLYHGRLLGLAGGGVTYLAGVTILDTTQFGAFLLIAGYFLGMVALVLNNPNKQKHHGGPPVTGGFR